MEHEDIRLLQYLQGLDPFEADDGVGSERTRTVYLTEWEGIEIPEAGELLV